MEELCAWAASWGDLASIAGLLLAIVGFAITIVDVRKSTRAAEQARQPRGWRTMTPSPT